VLQATSGSATGLGLVFAAGVVAQVVLLPVAGAVADRLGRRRVMLAADLLRFAAQAALAAAVFAGRPPLWLFVLLGSLVGTGEAFFSPALGALTVEMAPAAQLANANTLYGLAVSATRIGGPALAGVLIAATRQPATVIAADAASYLASVLALAAIRFRGSQPAGHGERRALRHDMAEGWAEFRSRTWLWTATVQWAFFNLLTWAPWMLLGPVAGRAYLGGSAVWGAIMAAQGGGAIVGGLLCLGRKPRRPLVLAMISMFFFALPDIPMALHAAAPWVAVAAFSCGAGSALSATFFSTAEQQQIPPDKLARVSSLTLFPSYGIGVLGYVIDGPLAAAIGGPAVFAIGAVYGMVSTALVLSLKPIRAVTWREQREYSPSAAGSVGPARGGHAEGGQRGGDQRDSA